MTLRIYITRRLPQPAHDRLREAGFQTEVYPEDRPAPHEVLLQAARVADGMICTLADRIDREVLEQAERLKIIANYAVGFNNIDMPEADRRGIAVTNTPGVLTEASADLTWALLMAAARRIVESDSFLRAGKFQGWGPLHFLGQDLTRRTLGIVGLGRIGKAVAWRATGFQMRVRYFSRHRDDDFEIGYPQEAKWVPLDSLLQTSDFVSLHVPYKPETHHLIGERELRLMQPHAILINTSRGAVVDEAALVKALKEQWIWGAGLDVYEEEPKVHPGLIGLPNAVLCPHIASATIETRTRMGLMAADNLIAFFAGKLPPNLVNQEVWKKS